MCAARLSTRSHIPGIQDDPCRPSPIGNADWVQCLSVSSSAVLVLWRYYKYLYGIVYMRARILDARRVGRGEARLECG